MQIKRNEIDAAIAVEVMGWFEQFGGGFGMWCTKEPDYDINGAVYVHRTVDHYTPSTDLNHAFEALEKFGNCRNYDIWRNESIFDSVVTPETFCVTLKLSNGIRTSARSIHKSLAIAICLALLSAVRGKQVTLEEYDAH